MLKRSLLAALILIPTLMCAVFHHVSHISALDAGRQMALRNDIAFVCDAQQGLAIWDLTDAANPVYMATSSAITNAAWVALQGDYAYVADASVGLRILDVSDPENPVLVGTYNSPPFSSAVEVCGNYAFLSSNSAVYVIDISNPVSPQLSQTITLASTLKQTVIDDNHLFVMTNGNINVYNLTVPFTQQIAGNISLPTSYNDFAVYDNLLYAGDYDAIRVYDVSNPSSIILLGTIETGHSIETINPCGDRLYIGAGEEGILVYELTSPAIAQYLGCYSNGGWVVYLNVTGNQVIAPIWKYGLLIVDCTDADFPMLLSSVPSPSPANCLISSGDYLYVGADFDLLTINKSDAANPTVTDQISYQNMDYVSNLAVSGRLMTVTSDYMFWTFSLVDYAIPSSIGWLDRSIQRVVFENGLMYGLGNGLEIIDMDNVFQPVVLSSFLFYSPGITLLDVQGDYAYASSYATDSLYVVNVANPENPYLVTTIELGSTYCNSLQVSGNTLVAGFDDRVCIVDISDPGQPEVISSIMYGAGEYPSVGFFTGNVLLIIESMTNHIQQYDLTNPVNPTMVSDFGWNLHTTGLFVDDDKLFTANEAHGISILNYPITGIPEEPDLPIPVSEIRISAYPNPFRDNLSVSYNLPKDDNVMLSVYNVKGQLVREMVKEKQSKGTHQLYWNGRDDKDLPCPSGVYFIKLKAKSGSRVAKILHIK